MNIPARPEYVFMSRLKHGLLLAGYLLFCASSATAADPAMEFYDPAEQQIAAAPSPPIAPPPAGPIEISIQAGVPLMTIPPRFYGLNVHPGSAKYELSNLALFKTLKPDSVRIMTRMRVDWLQGVGRQVHLLSPAPGSYDWSELDVLIDDIVDMGAEPYLALGFGPPHWLTTGSDPTGRLPPRKDALEAYADLMADIVRRYVVEKKLPVRSVSVDNEPENVHYPIEDYIQLTRLAKTKIKAVAPNVLVGGPTTGYAQWRQADGSAPGFGTSLARMKTESVPFDFIDWHIYSTSTGTVLDTVNTVKLTYGSTLPLVISELNRDWRYSGPEFEQSKQSNTGWESVAWLAYLYDRLQREGIQRVYYFAWRENALGLVDAQFKDLRPNYFLFRAMTGHLGRNRVVTTSTDPTVGSIATVQDGKLSVLVYNRTQKEVSIAVKGIAARPLAVANFNKPWYDSHDDVGNPVGFPGFASPVDLSGRTLKLAAGGFLLLEEH